MDGLILLTFIATRPFKVPPPKKKVNPALAVAAASFMARVAGASKVVVVEPQRGTCAAPPAPGGSFWVAVAAISILADVLLLWWHWHAQRTPPLPEPGRYQPHPIATAVAVPAPARRRTVATQSQCTYKRGVQPRFLGAFNFEGYVETHIH